VHILYPSSPLRAKQPDEQYAAEVSAVRTSGFDVSLFSFEDFQSDDFHAFPALPSTTAILYRGWMLSTEEYERLIAGVSGVGARLAVDRAAYLASHHLPQWYASLADLTPETRIYPPDCDLEAELRALSWPEFFIKDYVKSLKTSVGSRITKPEQVGAVVADMRRFRGVTGDVPPIVHECAKRLRSRFYSVDVVQRADGQPRIVEVGDGQVSDFVGWTPERFAGILADHFQHETRAA
jgi:hypothetical protein